ncbi:MAG: DUF4129 domain-containing protein [Chitinophagaceae bacterium]|nr:DUF4129 domain-containing protein [Chitinophagaceae bacterium]
MRKIIYISLLLMGFLSAAQAQKKIIYEDSSLLQKDEEVSATVDQVEVVKDSAVMVQPPVTAPEDDEPADTSLYKNDLNLSYDSIKNWRNLKEYTYTKYLDSLLKKEKKKEAKEPPRPRTGIISSLFNSNIVTVLLWTVAIAFVLFILYRLFLAEGAFKRKSKSVKAEAEVEEEIITKESDFDALIRQSLQSGNYRQAVRYQYLRTLHLLAEKNMVHLPPDKTNFQYVSEIANRNHQQPFASLTLNYEYVWYGEFEIDKNIYDKIESNFRGFNQKI